MDKKLTAEDDARRRQAEEEARRKKEQAIRADKSRRSAQEAAEMAEDQGPNEYGSAMLPEEINREALGDAVELFDVLRSGMRGEDQQLALYWTMRMFLGLRELGGLPALTRLVPGLWSVGVGSMDFLPRFHEFGLHVLVSSRIEKEPRHFFNLELPEADFPCWLHPVEITLHTPQIPPLFGTASCWGRSRCKTRHPIGPALLTAKHVAGTVLGAAVQLEGGAIGRVIDLAPDGIDAALVESPEPPGSQLISAMPFVAPWTKVELEGKKSGRIQTWVTTVTDTMGILNAPEWPARITIARPGIPGDSGALLIESSGGRAAGLYMGEFRDPAGRRGGICQHIFQVGSIMDLEILV